MKTLSSILAVLLLFNTWIFATSINGYVKAPLSSNIISEEFKNTLFSDSGTVKTLFRTDIDSLKITIMGSSVAWGSGATSNQGYNFFYTQLLSQRSKENKGLNWNVINKSIGGNTTQNVLDRWDRDLVSQKGKYVIYGLSLGNEGIHDAANQQKIFDQWKNNMLRLIDMAREKGMTPVIINNYTRADYNASDYDYIKKMDLLIHEWDVASVNVLGAIDDGAGHWAGGYQNDNAHPNDAGHKEFFYSMVPSLFDAISTGKPQPKIITGNYMVLKTNEKLSFTPENIAHPFTLSFDIKTTGSGTIASFIQSEKKGIISIDSKTGVVVYQSPNGNPIKGSIAINDGKWHKITLTHFFARGETRLYNDDVAVGLTFERLTPTDFFINDINGPKSINYRGLFFYRAGMNKEEIEALNQGKMLKSSLEIYAPLNGQAKNQSEQLFNYAQSTNKILLIP